MATQIKTSEGYNMVIGNTLERKALDSVISAKLYNENTAFFTPGDKLKFFYAKEVDLDYMNREITLQANDKTILVKCTILNQHAKVDKAVRKAYGK